MVGIGLEEVGVEEFVKGEFFNGELYIDQKKQSYSALGFKRFNIFNVFAAIFSKKARDAMSTAKEKKIDGNLTGDGMQNGGTLVVAKGGKLLLGFKQENPADHVESSDVLKALGLEPDTPSEGTSGKTEAKGAATKPTGYVCEEDVCRKT